MTARTLLRDAALVAATAATCFVVLAPLGSASSARVFNIRPAKVPGNWAQFVGLDWTCMYIQVDAATKRTYCSRASTPSGVRVLVDGDYVKVLLCSPTGACRTLLNTRPNP